MPTTIKCNACVEDFSLYPRVSIDSQHVTEIAVARAGGAEFGPGVIDKKSKRIIDGFHRRRERLRTDGPDAEWEVVEKTYHTEADMLLDAIRMNAGHGKHLLPYDKAHCLILAERMGMEVSIVARAMCVTVEHAELLMGTRTAKANGQTVPLKQTISHKAGCKLTHAQQDANKRLSGMRPAFYANQLILLLENDLIDKEDEKLAETLGKLAELLEKALAAK